MKVYSHPVTLMNVPYRLLVSFGSHSPNCKDDKFKECTGGGGFACHGIQTIGVGSRLFPGTLLHEIMEISCLLQGAHFSSNGESEEPHFFMNHTLFTSIVDSVAYDYVQMFSLIDENFAQDGMGNLTPDECGNFELVHNCDEEDDMAKKKKAKKPAKAPMVDKPKDKNKRKGSK